MVARGRVQNGVVILEEGVRLPEGMPVTVVAEAVTAPDTAEQSDRMSEKEHQELIAAFDRIAALPNEGSTEPFSGRDHDRVLYGAP